MDTGSSLQWPIGLKHTATRDRWFRVFAELPQGLNLQNISTRVAQPYASVYRWAELFHYDFPDLRREGRVSEDQWKQVNWADRDAVIARQLEISRERVRQVRAARGIGPSQHRAEVQKFTRWIQTNMDRLQGLPVHETLRMFGGDMSQQVARRVLRLQGVRRHDPTSRWRHIDWRLPNRDLAQLWSTSAKYIANVRARLKMGPAIWDAKSATTEANSEYQQALAQEMLKARSSRKGRVKASRPAPVLVELA